MISHRKDYIEEILSITHSHYGRMRKRLATLIVKVYWIILGLTSTNPDIFFGSRPSPLVVVELQIRAKTKKSVTYSLVIDINIYTYFLFA